MGDSESTQIASLQKLVLEFSRERDWLQFHSPKNLASAIAAEAGELLSLFRWMEGPESEAFVRSERRTEVEDELADVLILAFEMAAVMGSDVETIVRRKLAVNEERYPVEKSRGTHTKYDRL
jgi:dCTP diphosphatase